MKRFVVAMMAILVTGCGDELIAPPQQGLLTIAEPTFLRFSDDAFDAAEKQASFWAVKGQDRTVELRYSDSGDAFVRFEVGAASLSRYPDGSVFSEGDSVLISVRVNADGEMSFRFSPSGLQFNSEQPAVLTMSHARKNPDVNRDGHVDLVDALLAADVGTWKQELPLLPWFKIPSVQLLGDAVRADIQDFTGFGMAVN